MQGWFRQGVIELWQGTLAKQVSWQLLQYFALNDLYSKSICSNEPNERVEYNLV